MDKKDKKLKDKKIWCRNEVVELAYYLRPKYRDITIIILNENGAMAIAFNKREGDAFYPPDITIDLIDYYIICTKESPFYPIALKEGLFKYDYWYIFD